jgi:hypothetical protein
MATSDGSAAEATLPTRELRYVGAALALLVAAIHLYHPDRGMPRLVTLLITDNAALLVSDPRPLLFVLSGAAIVVAVIAVLWGVPRRPLYAGGMALMATYVVGYFGWHLTGHGGFLPGRAPVYHGLSPVAAVVDHLSTYPVALLAVVGELSLLAVLWVLYRRAG